MEDMETTEPDSTTVNSATKQDEVEPIEEDTPPAEVKAEETVEDKDEDDDEARAEATFR
jgi:hypothetical protein